MPDWNTLRRRAYTQHQRLRVHLPPDAPLLLPADLLLEAAEKETGVDRRAVPRDDSLLAGAHAVLDRDFPGIWYASGPDTSPARQRFAQAHEFAHYWLHPEIGEDRCVTDDTPEAFAPPSFRLNNGQVAEGYSHRERRESEANLFAAELLLPAPVLRRVFQEDGQTASRIAAHTGLSQSCVLSQLTSALLLPTQYREEGRGKREKGKEDQGQYVFSSPTPNSFSLFPFPSSLPADGLDASQRAAARIMEGPTLVDAGPGTGKTRTLIARILFLLTERGVAPENILALTFSNKAAEEMHTRLRAAVGDKADRVWIGTFHAFGRELLRKEGRQIGLSLAGDLLDLPDAIALLEKHVDRLRLRHFEYLNQPILPFADILDCISRAKDELITPHEFATLAEQQIELAAQQEQAVQQYAIKKEQAKQRKEAETRRVAGEKWREVAQVYAVYQDLLRQERQLDFGDLLMRSVELLDTFPDVRERWQAQYPHILADEYQDINRASARLVQRLAGTGRGLWAVGDLRQAIYRFRGASPANVRDFDQDFPGAQRVQLERNYRSSAPLVAMFGAYAGEMAGTGATFSDWQPHRAGEQSAEDLPAITVAVAEDEEAQADGLAAHIRRWEGRGVPLPQQVILCYTHKQASRLSEMLGARGVETQHLSGLFDRDEIKDLFAVLSLACEPEGTALKRVARFAEYAIPDEDALALLRAAKAQRLAFPGALQLAASLPDLSPAGREGMARLWQHLRPLLYSRTAWTLLTGYLFETSGYLRPLLADASQTARQRLLAIHELLVVALRLAKRFETEENAPLAFLNHLRYLLACRQEKSIRMAGDDGELEGVRLMTVHRSKGLEFPVVYVPNLVKGQFPSGGKGKMVNPPADWTDPANALAANSTDGDENDDDADGEEAERLFFVALSRARDALVLSYPLTWNGKPATRSKLLTQCDAALDACGAQRVMWNRVPERTAEADKDDLVTFTAETTMVSGTEQDSGTQNASAVSASEGRLAAGHSDGCFQHPEQSIVEQEPLTISASAAEQYQACPRRYYYERVLRLPARREDSPYLACRSGWADTVKWLQTERQEGRSPSLEEANAYMQARWNEPGHALTGAQGRVLRERATQWLHTAHAEIQQAQTVTPNLELQAHLEHGTIRVPIDHAEPSEDDGIRLVDYKTRRNAKEDHTNIRLALARHAARQEQPDRPVQIALSYLHDGEQREVEEKKHLEPARVQKYDDALKGIREERFAPNPNPSRCAECPFFLVCPL